MFIMSPLFVGIPDAFVHFLQLAWSITTDEMTASKKYHKSVSAAFAFKIHKSYVSLLFKGTPWDETFLILSILKI